MLCQVRLEASPYSFDDSTPCHICCHHGHENAGHFTSGVLLMPWCMLQVCVQYGGSSTQNIQQDLDDMDLSDLKLRTHAVCEIPIGGPLESEPALPLQSPGSCCRTCMATVRYRLYQ